MASAERFIIVGAGPVGALAAIYAAQRGNDVEIYELRSGKLACFIDVTVLHNFMSLFHLLF